ncbi:glycosyltransferase [Thioflexithrix psekupsensis]|uniref:Glycosyltransferase 2-like domain-containing protein n=1 Tax=Thioflexithrix psekupsensis TaxID=1570016 RepID=A0A251X6S9_9GAMM|nr:glycosyltransferase [Thioflexithrix psekupsensis]OUD13171.1 hypothetical protein TPSD3_11050 [Thioflexithrix psekupsensis]
MQIIVLGMHRSGTSAVARLLNMMGCYFAPERMELPATEANPKGYWERRDVVNLNEEILTHLKYKWDLIANYNSQISVSENIPEYFSSRAKEIILGLDANRPWMIKDPRLCLLMPFWLPLHELPVCIYVYRDPLEVALSLQKREGFSINYGLALWEKYTLIALNDSQTIPRFLVSYHELMEEPIATVQKMYQALLDLQIQGLRLPNDNEILAFIDPQLHHQKYRAAEHYSSHLSCAQKQLVDMFEEGTILTQSPLPKLSASAQECLSDYECQLSVKQSLNQSREETQQVHEKLTTVESNLRFKEELVASLSKDKSDLLKKSAKYEVELAELKQAALSLKDQYQSLQKEHSILQKEWSNIHHQSTAQRAELAQYKEKLENQQQQQDMAIRTVRALDVDIRAVFNSLTWKIGDTMTRMALRLLFRRPDKTAKDHIEETIAEFGQRFQVSVGVAEKPPVSKPNSSSTLELVSKKIEQRFIKNYRHWINNYDTLNTSVIKKMEHVMLQWGNKPIISIIMPTYNTDERWLRKAIDSVLNQIYPHWELCIADDASTSPHVADILREYAQKDSRIKLVFRTENGHISEASNSALALATGHYITFLDHDDMLSQHALFWVVEDMQQYPNHKMWYSDEDKVNESDERYEPYFKCDWNPDLFLSHNLVTHLAVYQADLIHEVGGLRKGYEGAQDYDLVLRVIEKISPVEIRHIPRILYHWRAIQGSTATSPDEKPYALLAAQKAIGEFLQRKGIQNAEVSENPEIKGTIRVKYPIPDPAPLVSLIIPTRNGLHLLQRCVESILAKTLYRKFEIIIIDNESDDPDTLAYFQQLEKEKQARIISYPHPFNYADMNNMAVQFAQGELVGLLNNDLEVINPEWLGEMVSHAIRPEIGVVGARLWYPNETLQHAGVILGIGGSAGHAHKGFKRGNVGYFGRAALIQNYSAVTGACLLVRKNIFEQVGGLNAEHLKVAFNDVDFCLKTLQLGVRCLWTPFAELYHHESASRGYEDTPEKVARFEKERLYLREQWPQYIVGDPAYSFNLTLDAEDFSYAWPPRLPLIV